MRALLVIDMLRDFIEPDGKLSCGPAGEAIVPFVKALLDELRSRGGGNCPLRQSFAR